MEKKLAVLLVVALVTTHLAQRVVVAASLPKPATLVEALPSVRALRLLALSYRSLVADYYWLRALSHFGDNAMHAAKYPNLRALTTRVLALDPYFADAYFFAGTALTVKGMDPQFSIDLLEQGLRYRSDDWRVPFLLGFNCYYFKGDYGRGAEVLAIAARNPQAPPVAGPLAARLAAEADEPELGLSMIDSILPGITDERLRGQYEERRRLLELEVQLKFLNQASRRYQERFGHAPRELSQLVGPGLLQRLPDEPLGGAYHLGEGGVVGSSNEALRLHLGARGTPPRGTP